MNRMQRRHAPQRPLTMEHGHNGERIIVVFSMSIQNLQLTPAEADAFVAAIQGSKQRLAEYRASQEKAEKNG